MPWTPGLSPATPAAQPEGGWRPTGCAGRPPGFVSWASGPGPPSRPAPSANPGSRLQCSDAKLPQSPHLKMTTSCNHPYLDWESQPGPFSSLCPRPHPHPRQKKKVFSKEIKTRFGVNLTLAWEEKEKYKFGTQRRGNLVS